MKYVYILHSVQFNSPFILGLHTFIPFTSKFAAEDMQEHAFKLLFCSVNVASRPPVVLPLGYILPDILMCLIPYEVCQKRLSQTTRAMKVVDCSLSPQNFVNVVSLKKKKIAIPVKKKKKRNSGTH